MEDFLELMNIEPKDNKDFLNDAIDYFNKNSFKEMCGFIYFQNQFKFEKATNYSNSVDYFEIHPAEFLNFKLNKNLVAIIHSHINGDENLSQEDKESSENCLYPYLIYSTKTKKFSFYYKDDYEPKIELIKKLENLINDY